MEHFRRTVMAKNKVDHAYQAFFAEVSVMPRTVTGCDFLNNFLLNFLRGRRHAAFILHKWNMEDSDVRPLSQQHSLVQQSSLSPGNTRNLKGVSSQGKVVVMHGCKTGKIHHKSNFSAGVKTGKSHHRSNFKRSVCVSGGGGGGRYREVLKAYINDNQKPHKEVVSGD